MKGRQALLLIFITCIISCSSRAQDAVYADYNTALTRTMKLEGGYVQEPRARGGQIYRGITRVSHPGWEGWKIVDQRAMQRGDTIAELDALVAEFYKTYYWDRIRAGELTDQQTANNYFNTAVKLGLDRGIMKAQRSVGMRPTAVVTDTLISRLNTRQPSLHGTAKKANPHHSKKRRSTHHHSTHRHRHT